MRDYGASSAQARRSLARNDAPPARAQAIRAAVMDALSA